MPVALHIEFDTPKETERNKKRYQWSRELFRPYYNKKREEGVKWEANGWADGTGNVIAWHQFETMADFDKIWNDEEFQAMMVRWSYLVDNARLRILRPTFSVEPE